MKPKYNSHCEVCKRPCVAPRGNFNAQRISLCQRPECRRRRKTELQKERRRQQELFAPVRNSHAKQKLVRRAVAKKT